MTPTSGAPGAAGSAASPAADKTATGAAIGPVETALRAKRDQGRKLLVPYITGGLGEDWVDVFRAIADAGADAVEVGIPFSDPTMDGPTIQLASMRALEGGTTPRTVLAGLAEVADHEIPRVVMTYYNVVYRPGPAQFARRLVEAGVGGAIVPDLPLDEIDEWALPAAAAGVETILLAAPTTPDDRLAAICARSRGWIYAVGTMGVTGMRDQLAASATILGRRLKAVTDRPILIGVGVSTPEQAAEASAAADGVIVGAALVSRLLDGAGPAGAASFVASLRARLDSM